MITRLRLPLTIQLTGLTVGAAGFQGMTALMTAKWLGASERGVIAIAQTLSMVLLLVGCAGLTTGTRVVLADDSRRIDFRSYVRATRWLLLSQLILVTAVGLSVFIRLTHISAAAVAISFIIIGVGSLRAALLREAFHGVGWHRAAVFSELLAAVVPLLLVIAAHYRGVLSLSVAMLSLAAGYITQLILQSLFARRYLAQSRTETVTNRAGLALLRYILRFCLPGFVATLGFAFAGRMDRLVLAYFHNTAAVGVYSTASTLADAAWIIPMASSALIVRQVAQTKSPQAHRLWWRRILLMTVAMSLVIFVASAWLLTHFLGPEFASGIPVVAVLLVGALALASQQVDLAVCSGMGDLGASAHVALAGVLVAAVLFFSLIPPFGAMGCALASAATYFVTAAVARLRLRKHLSVELGAA